NPSSTHLYTLSLHDALPILPAKVFFDTNVLIYAVAHDEPRSTQAEELLASGGVLSVQILNEFASVARRKILMSWSEVTEALDALDRKSTRLNSSHVEISYAV